MNFARRFASSASASFRAELQSCKSLRDVEDLIVRSPLTAINATNCASAVNLLGRMKSTQQDALQKLMQVYSSPTTEFTPNELAQLCTGIAVGKLDTKFPTNVIKQLEREDKLSGMEPRQLVWTLGSFAILEQPAEWLCALVKKQIIACSKSETGLSKFTGNEFALVMHYFDKFGFHQGLPEVLELFSKEISQRESLSDFTAAHIALLLDSFSQEREGNERSTPMYIHNLCKRISRDIVFDRRGLVEQFEPRDFALVLNCFAEFNIRDQALCDLFCKEILRRSSNKSENGLAAFQQEHIGRILGSLEHLDFVNAEVVERLMMEVMRREDDEEKKDQQEIEEDTGDKEDREDEQLRRMAKAMRNKPTSFEK